MRVERNGVLVWAPPRVWYAQLPCLHFVCCMMVQPAMFFLCPTRFFWVLLSVCWAVVYVQRCNAPQQKECKHAHVRVVQNSGPAVVDGSRQRGLLLLYTRVVSYFRDAHHAAQHDRKRSNTYLVGNTYLGRQHGALLVLCCCCIIRVQCYFYRVILFLVSHDYLLLILKKKVVFLSKILFLPTSRSK